MKWVNILQSGVKVVAGRYKLYRKDCLEILPVIKSNSVDLILCDLPYGITANKWDSIINFSILWKEFNRITKDTSAIILTASQPFTSLIIMSNLKQFKHEWIWLKNVGSNFLNCKREPIKEHESVLVFSKKKWMYNPQMQERLESGRKAVMAGFISSSKGSTNYGKFDRKKVKYDELRNPTSFQKFNVERGLHPTQKPVELLRYFIKTYSNKNNIVLDCCMGSGSTGVAAMLEKRKFIGIEKDHTYYKIAKIRIKAARHNTVLTKKQVKEKLELE